MIWASVVTVFLALALWDYNIFNKDKLKEDYYEILVTVSDLFKDHTQFEENQFYNPSYPSKEEVKDLLGDKVTDNGLELVIEGLFVEYDNLFVYKQQYQEYLSDTRDFSLKERDNKYYKTVQNTILNPALRLIPFNELEVFSEKNIVNVKGEGIEVQFYDDREKLTEYHQYARYGYPPKDYFNISLTFVAEDGKYLLDDFQLTSIEM